MNILLTRTKNEHLNVCWEPFATSTPLKPSSNNVKIISVPKEELLMHSNSPDFVHKIRKSRRTTNALQKESSESKPLVSKNIRKKKSSIYFDLTSSSDEDSLDGNKKRPIIELRSGKRTRSILVNKNLCNEKINIEGEINNCEKLKNMSNNDCETNAILNIEDLKSKNVQSRSSKNTALNDTPNLINTSFSSDTCSKIFDETRGAKNIIKDITLRLINEENTKNNVKNCDSLKHLNLDSDREKRVLKETSIRNSVLKKNVHRNNGCEPKSLNVLQRRSSECNKSCKSKKRKGKGDENTNNTVKKSRIKKISNKLVSHLIDMPAENSQNLLHIWECKTNVSHQLFSDSKGQELINILDLTSEEIDEKIKNITSSSIKNNDKLPYMSSINNSSHPSSNKSLILNEFKQNCPKRKKQDQKKSFVLENFSNELLQKVNAEKEVKSEKNSKAKLTNIYQVPEFQAQMKSDELNMLSEGVREDSLIKDNGENIKALRKSKRKTASASKKSKTSFTVSDQKRKSKEVVKVSKSKDNKVRNSEVNNGLDSVGSIADNNISDSNKPLVPEEDKKAVDGKKPVFKLLNELSYKENEMGCSVALGWSINNFKCGVFKLKTKSQISCKTLRCSNLGGVLIKGNLRMKIGNRVLNLTKGDMVFVPPLTEWLATNIGKCEALFYYWCGRFDV